MLQRYYIADIVETFGWYLMRMQWWQIVHIGLKCIENVCNPPFYKGDDDDALQHTATHCKACSTLQHTTTPCIALPYTATHSTTLPHTVLHCHTQYYTATHCAALQHTATHLNTATLLHTFAASP